MKPPFAELNPDSIGIEGPSEGPSAGSALGLLQAIYRDPCQPQTIRMRAATVAIAYETPKLSVGLRTDHRGMGDALDRAHAKHLEARREKPEAPVGSAPGGASFRRIAPAMTGDEATIGASPKRKPG